MFPCEKHFGWNLLWNLKNNLTQFIYLMETVNLISGRFQVGSCLCSLVVSAPISFQEVLFLTKKSMQNYLIVSKWIIPERLQSICVIHHVGEVKRTWVNRLVPNTLKNEGQVWCRRINKLFVLPFSFPRIPLYLTVFLNLLWKCNNTFQGFLKWERLMLFMMLIFTRCLPYPQCSQVCSTSLIFKRLVSVYA